MNVTINRLNKFKHNQIRDKEVLTLLEKSGWCVPVLWECELADLDSCVPRFERSSQETAYYQIISAARRI